MINEDLYRKCLATVAPEENDAMLRVMGGSMNRGHIQGVPMEDRINNFAAACGAEGAKMVDLAKRLMLPMSTLKTHANRALAAGAVTKVQEKRNKPATFFDAREAP